MTTQSQKSPPFPTTFDDWGGKYKQNRPIWLKPTGSIMGTCLARHYRHGIIHGLTVMQAIIWAGRATTDDRAHSRSRNYDHRRKKTVSDSEIIIRLKKNGNRLWRSKNAPGWVHAFWMNREYIIPILLPWLIDRVGLDPSTPWQIVADFSQDHCTDFPLEWEVLRILSSPIPPWQMEDQ